MPEYQASLDEMDELSCFFCVKAQQANAVNALLQRYVPMLDYQALQPMQSTVC